MADFKFVVSDPQTKKSHQIVVEQGRAVGIVGKKIGDSFNGELIGLTGYTLQITGGTDRDGFAMHPQVGGQGKKRVLLSGAPGFHPWKKGMRKRKTVRGDTISPDIVQVNVKVLTRGTVNLEEVATTKSKEKIKEEKAKEEKVKEEKAKPAEHVAEKVEKKKEKVEEKVAEKKEEGKEKEGGESKKE